MGNQPVFFFGFFPSLNVFKSIYYMLKYTLALLAKAKSPKKPIIPVALLKERFNITNTNHHHARREIHETWVENPTNRKMDPEEIADRMEDVALGGGRASRGGKGGRGGRSGGGGGGGSSRGGRGVQLSKALSRLLRHQAGSAGIDLDKEGYAPLDKVVSY